MKIHTTLGITVAALALAFVGNVSAEAPANASAEQKPESKALDVGSMNITICYEAFSLPIAKAGEIERLLVLRTKSGQRAFVESVTEHRYPSEFTDGCTLFRVLAKAKEGENGQKVIEVTKPNVWPIIPTSTEKRDVGDTLEIEPTVSDEGSGVNFQICVTHVAQSKREKWGKGLAEFEQPQYETQKLSTNAAASFKSPCFIGTLSPPFGNGLAARTEQKVWFCFITATALKNADAVTGKSAK